MEDRRDLRDPTLLGRALFNAAYNDEKIRWHYDPEHDGVQVDVPLSLIYDKEVHKKEIASFSPQQSATDVTVPAYRERMQRQAAQGDLVACRTLLDKGWALPLDMDQATLERAREMQSVEAEVVFDAPVQKKVSRADNQGQEVDVRNCWGNGDAWYHATHLWNDNAGEHKCPGF